ncbi:hypothetical protein [Streptomyces sp. NPDC047315]|uniref:hypothetical protein n=1 Tax=Streptomyces sp. NPDC047315 TaxID=3155142 RepID=UPI0033E66721
MRRRRLALALSGIAASAFLIGGAGQLAKMVVPDGAPRAAAGEVAPVLIGGFLIGGAAQFATEDGGQQDAQDRVVLAMNKAELVGA